MSREVVLGRTSARANTTFKVEVDTTHPTVRAAIDSCQALAKHYAKAAVTIAYAPVVHGAYDKMSDSFVTNGFVDGQLHSVALRVCASEIGAAAALVNELRAIVMYELFPGQPELLDFDLYGSQTGLQVALMAALGLV